MLNRAVQQVYTIEPEEFGGFDYGILANNVNCVFCHTKVDSVDRFFNGDPSLFGGFDRIKVERLDGSEPQVPARSYDPDPDVLSSQSLHGPKQEFMTLFG